LAFCQADGPGIAEGHDAVDESHADGDYRDCATQDDRAAVALPVGILDGMDEDVKFTLLTRCNAGYRVDGCSEWQESAARMSARITQSAIGSIAAVWILAKGGA